MMKIKLLLTAGFCGLVVSACSPKTALVVDFSNVPDTFHCQHMKDVCKEAESFQSQFLSMSGEEKADAKIILNAYVQQCEDAQEICRKSAELNQQ
ncbi:MAG: hypothetical protein LBI42_02545 [Chitinispirillales bacterium]|nr:hypothetical protein [Chitinispirillales bacterium]